MKETGVVRRIAGDIAVIEIAPPEACSKCCSCGTGKPRTIKVQAGGLELEEGMEIELEIEDRAMMGLYLLLYGIPAAAFVAGVVVVQSLLGRPVIAACSGLLLVAVSYCVAAARVKKNKRFMPRVRRSERQA